jgi:hypothetical protein
LLYTGAGFLTIGKPIEEGFDLGHMAVIEKRISTRSDLLSRV